MNETFEKGIVTDYVLTLATRDERHLTVSFNASVFRDPSANVGGIFASARDITEQSQLQTQLAEERAYNRGLIEASVDGLVTVDETMKITDVNETMCRMVGRPLKVRLQRAMRETHHRVKNSLQLIAAIVDLEADEVERPELTFEFRRINQHIRALAAIHDMLTHENLTNDSTKISAKKALGKLILIFGDLVGTERFCVTVEDLLLPIAQVTSLTILVNEFVNNALKHGAGNIVISLSVISYRRKSRGFGKLLCSRAILFSVVPPPQHSPFAPPREVHLLAKNQSGHYRRRRIGLRILTRLLYALPKRSIQEMCGISQISWTECFGS